ncbi:MAG: acetate--CoA ligase family protein [Alphaproteobacteria bacterium]|nr:acetate--CoA ligase family protein [Alphaproteobacteria bacterium]
MQRRYEAAGIGVYEDPWRAVEAIAAATRCAERIATAPHPVPAVSAGLTPLPKHALGEHEAKAILAAAGIPILEERLATTAAEAAACADLGEKLVLKIASPQIAHKTEVGGVMLNVPSSEAGAAYTELMTRVAQRAPDANLEGVLISPMLTDGTEMILGVQHDGVFGPTVLLGLGGIFVEVLRDVTFRIAPFGLEEARAMIGELRGKAILKGARGKPAGDIEALAQTLSKLSLFAAAQKGQFSSIDINPLLVRPQGKGVVALDALIVTDATPAAHH